MQFFSPMSIDYWYQLGEWTETTKQPLTTWALGKTFDFFHPKDSKNTNNFMNNDNSNGNMNMNMITMALGRMFKSHDGGQKKLFVLP